MTPPLVYLYDDCIGNMRIIKRNPGMADKGKVLYEIRIKNHLEDRWAEWFDGWTITNLENGEVLLSRINPDQASIHGVLNKIRDLNLQLISVTRK
jgi:hypothetical protein